MSFCKLLYFFYKSKVINFLFAFERAKVVVSNCRKKMIVSEAALPYFVGLSSARKFGSGVWLVLLNYVSSHHAAVTPEDPREGEGKREGWGSEGGDGRRDLKP